MDLDAAPRELRGRVLAEPGGISGRIFGAASTSTQRCGASRGRVVAERVAHEVGELGERLDARVAGADEDEREVARRALGVAPRRRLELLQHVVAEVDRVGEVLEAEPVLGEAGDRQRPRDRAERERRGCS